METKEDIDLLKEKMASGDYRMYFKHSNGEYEEKEQPQYLSETTTYKLIHNKDAEIAKAVAKDSSVEVEFRTWNRGEFLSVDICFFKGYDEQFDYRLKPVVKESLTTESTIGKSPTVETISIKDGDKVYKYTKDPAYRTELYSVKGSFIIGYIWNGLKHKAIRWEKDTGKADDDKGFNLTPVQEQWYEAKNVNALCVYLSSGAYYRIVDYKDGLLISDDTFRFKPENLRLATKAERGSLHVKEDNTND